MNLLTTFPITASFLMVLLVIFACALFRRRGRRGQEKAMHGDAVAKPLPNNATPVMHANPERTENSSPEDRIKELEKHVLELEQEVTRFKNQRKEMKKNIKFYRETAKAVRQAVNKLRKERADKGETRAVAGKRTGKKPGSAGGGFIRPDKIDRTKHWHLNTCPVCGASLAGCNPVSSWEHVIIDVERPRNKRGMLWVTTKHVMYRYRCPCCKKIVAKDLGIYKHLHYGIGIIAFALQERMEHRGSWDGIRETAIHVFGKDYVPTIQAFIDWVKDLTDIARLVHMGFKEAIKASTCVHSDETGLPMDGDNRWLWILVTAHVVLFLPSKSRGHETIQDIFEGYKGVLVADFWSAYNMLDVEQQKCLAHVIVELKEIEHLASEEAARNHTSLDKDDEAKASVDTDAANSKNMDATIGTVAAPVKTKKRGRPPKREEPLTVEQRTKIEAKIEQNDKAFAQARELQQFFDEAWGEGKMGYKTPVENRMSIDEAVNLMQVYIDKIRAEGFANDDIRRLIDRLEKFNRYLFTYLEHDDVTPDNNAAERPLRHFVTQRKISGNFVSPEVMDVYAVLLSLEKTCKLNDVSFEAVLPILLKGDVMNVFTHLGVPPPKELQQDFGSQMRPPGTDS